MRTKLLAALLGTGLVISSGVHAFPSSVKAGGMGGAAVANAQDSLTSFDNPANAAEICDRLDFSGFWQGERKQVTIADRPVLTPAVQEGTIHANRDSRLFGEIGGNLWINDCLALGIAWTYYDHIRTDFSGHIDDLAPSDPLTGLPVGPNTRLEYDVECVSAVAAFPFEMCGTCHSLGLAMNVYLSRFLVYGVGAFATEEFSESADRFSDNGRDHSTGIGVTLGWVGRLCPDFTFGLAYSPRVHMARLRNYEGFLTDHRIDIPETVRAGVAWDATCCLTLALDGEYRRYSRVRSLSDPFQGDSTTGFPILFGTRGGPGFGWRDQWIAKVGLAWQCIPCLTLRTGYRFERIPFRAGSSSSALNVLTLQTVENYLTAGASWWVTDYLELSLYGEYGIPNKVRSRYPTITNFDEAELIFFPANLTFKAQNYRAGLQISGMF